MRKLQVVSILFAFLFLSCEQSTEPGSPGLEIVWTDQQSVVCFGTSLTWGFIGMPGPTTIPPVRNVPDLSCMTAAATVGADTVSYPALLAQSLRIRVYKQARLGMTTEGALSIVGDSVFTKKPALVLLEFGANDLLSGVNVQVAEQQLARLADTLRAFGSNVALVSFLYSDMIESIPSTSILSSRKEEGRAYLSMLRRVGETHADLFIEYAMSGIYWNAELMSDAIHPNAAGYRIMKNNVEAAMAETFRRSGMYK